MVQRMVGNTICKLITLQYRWMCDTTCAQHTVITTSVLYNIIIYCYRVIHLYICNLHLFSHVDSAGVTRRNGMLLQRTGVYQALL